MSNEVMLARRNGEALNIEINEWIDEIREERAKELSNELI